MSRVSLVQLNPRRASDGVVQVLRFGHNARTKARFLGLDWLPGIIALPDTELDLGFDGSKFGQGATPQVGQLRIAIGKADAWAGLVWKGAAGSLRSAPWPAGSADPDDAAFTVDLSCRVESISIDDGVATLTLIDLGADLRRPLITRKFGSTGNALLDGAGVVDRRGQVIPTGWGRLRSVPGILVDRVKNVWLLLDRPSSSVQGFFDGGAAFTTGVAHATLAALQAAAPAAGAVDYCLDADGLTLARPWTAPTYPFTADLTATGNQTAAGIAQSVVATRSSLVFQAGTIAAFDALYAASCGLYVDDERTIATALDELIVRLGGFWRLSGAGEIVLGRLAPAAPVRTFGQTEVFSIARQSIVMPTRRRAVGYARNNRVHNEGEIATILLADDVAYADGTPIEALKPAAAGATRNVVTYGATAPASPIDGDLWVNTSGTFAVFNLRVAGTWQVGANALSAYNALSGRPVALADINTTESSKLSGIQAGATVGAPQGTAVGGVPVEIGYAMTPTGMLETWALHADIASVQRAWLLTAAGVAELIVGASAMTGGVALRITGIKSVVGKHRIPYAFEDLYRVKARIFVENVGTGGNTHYLGVAAYDASGELITPTDVGTFHYTGGIYNSLPVGFHEIEGYFRGRATVGSGNNVGGSQQNPSEPTPIAAPAVTVAPILLANYNGSDGLVWLDYIAIEKVEDLTALPSRPWAAGDFQKRGQAVTHLGRSWIARIDNTGVTPPSTSTGNVTWALLADKGIDGATGAAGVDALIVTSDIYAVTIPCDAGGVPVSGALPITVTMRAQVGATNVTPGTTWSAPAMTGCVVTNLGGGQYRIDSVGADSGRFVITATNGGRSQNVAVTFAKAPAGRAAVSIRDDTLLQATSASYITASDIFILPFGPGQTLNLSVSGVYGITGAPAQGAQGRIIARLMYRNVTDGGAWTQAGAEIDGSFAVANYVVFPTEPQHVPGTIGGARTGPSAPATLKVFEVRLDLRLDGVAVTQSLALAASIT
ncbi:MAG: hypothetical protein ACK5SX_16210 [Sandaracinobacter sp.]